MVVRHGINRNILECKDESSRAGTERKNVLIETYCNVKVDRFRRTVEGAAVLIETYWNVKVLSAGGSGALYSEVGKIFLPSGLLTFFIVGGPLFGVLTSMVPVIMLTCAQIQAAADNDLFPAFVAKKNKNGVSPVILCFVMLFSIACVATGSSFGVLMTVFSFVNALSDIVLCMVPFFLKKKYPHACNHSIFKMAIGLVYALSAFAFIVAAYLAYAMISTLGMTVWLMILGAVVLFVIYILIRIAYLKKHGRDLIAELKQPYEPWEARERECKALDEVK